MTIRTHTSSSSHPLQSEGKEMSKEEKQRLRKEKKHQKKNKEKKDEQAPVVVVVAAVESRREQKPSGPCLPSQPVVHKGSRSSVAIIIVVKHHRVMTTSRVNCHTTIHSVVVAVTSVIYSLIRQWLCDDYIIPRCVYAQCTQNRFALSGSRLTCTLLSTKLFC